MSIFFFGSSSFYAKHLKIILLLYNLKITLNFKLSYGGIFMNLLQRTIILCLLVSFPAQSVRPGGFLNIFASKPAPIFLQKNKKAVITGVICLGAGLLLSSYLYRSHKVTSRGLAEVEEKLIASRQAQSGLPVQFGPQRAVLGQVQQDPDTIQREPEANSEAPERREHPIASETVFIRKSDGDRIHQDFLESKEKELKVQAQHDQNLEEAQAPVVQKQVEVVSNRGVSCLGRAQDGQVSSIPVAVAPVAIGVKQNLSSNGSFWEKYKQIKKKQEWLILDEGKLGDFITGKLNGKGLHGKREGGGVADVYTALNTSEMQKQWIARGGAHFYQIRNARNIDISDLSQPEYLQMLLEISWFLESLAIHKGEEHEEGTLIFPFIQPFYDLQLNYIKKFNSGGWQNPVGTPTNLFTLNSFGYSRTSTHFQKTQTSDNPHYGIDIRVGNEGQAQPWLPALKRHILFGNLGDGFMFNKFENYGLKLNDGLFSHVCEWFISRWRKWIPGSNDQPNWRKEHLPDDIKQKFKQVCKSCNLPEEIADKIEEMREIVRLEQYHPELVEKLASSEHYKQLLREIRLTYDHAEHRYGREVIIMPEELLLANFYHLQLVDKEAAQEAKKALEAIIEVRRAIKQFRTAVLKENDQKKEQFINAIKTQCRLLEGVRLEKINAHDKELADYIGNCLKCLSIACKKWNNGQCEGCLFCPPYDILSTSSQKVILQHDEREEKLKTFDDNVVKPALNQFKKRMNDHLKQLRDNLGAAIVSDASNPVNNRLELRKELRQEVNTLFDDFTGLGHYQDLRTISSELHNELQLFIKNHLQQEVEGLSSSWMGNPNLSENVVSLFKQACIDMLKEWKEFVKYLGTRAQEFGLFITTKGKAYRIFLQEQERLRTYVRERMDQVNKFFPEKVGFYIRQWPHLPVERNTEKKIKDHIESMFKCEGFKAYGISNELQEEFNQRLTAKLSGGKLSDEALVKLYQELIAEIFNEIERVYLKPFDDKTEFYESEAKAKQQLSSAVTTIIENIKRATAFEKGASRPGKTVHEWRPLGDSEEFNYNSKAVKLLKLLNYWVRTYIMPGSSSFDCEQGE